MGSKLPFGMKGYASLIPSGGTQIDLPYFSALPFSPTNNTYPPVVNGALGGSLKSAGDYTPTITIQTAALSGWFTAANLSALLATRDSDNNTTAWTAVFNDGTTGGTYSTRKYAGIRWSSLRLTWDKRNPANTMIGITLTGLAQTDADTTSYTSYAPVVGSMLSSTSIDFGGSATADDVIAADIALLNGQAHQHYTNTSQYPDHVASGMAGGAVTLTQSPQYTVTPGATLTVRVGATPVVMTLKTDFTQANYPITPSRGVIERTYQLINLSTGAVPFSFA